MNAEVSTTNNSSNDMEIVTDYNNEEDNSNTISEDPYSMLYVDCK